MILAARLAQQLGQERRGDPDHRHDVDVEHPAPVVERVVEEGPGAVDAGVVDEGVDRTAERLLALLDQLCDRGVVGDVAPHGHRLGSGGPDGRRGGLDLGFGARREDDRRAGGRQLLGHRPPDAPTGARDDRPPPGQHAARPRVAHRAHRAVADLTRRPPDRSWPMSPHRSR